MIGLMFVSETCIHHSTVEFDLTSSADIKVVTKLLYRYRTLSSSIAAHAHRTRRSLLAPQ